MHEYSVIGHPRETVIFWIAFVAIVVGPTSISLFEAAATSLTGQVVSITFAVSAIFSTVYFVFNKWLWKLVLFGKVFSFPNLNGSWTCRGKTLGNDGSTKHEWNGTVVIEQKWDKILISMKTDQSTSRSLSVTCGIKHIPGMGYQLTYHYENTPAINQPELKKHEGFCTLIFDEDLCSAHGHYFNDPSRFTFGEIHLKQGAYHA